MRRISPRPRVIVAAVIAALALAISPALAAAAAGPGSATITLTGDSVPSFAFGQVTGPEGPSNAFFSAGTANLSDLALGDYTLTVGSSASSQGGSVAFTLTAEAPDFVGDLALIPWPTGTSSVSGTVVDGDGVPIAGASISVFSGSRPFPQVTTDADGTYTVPNLVAGDYSLGAFEFSHFSRQVQFTVGDDDAATVDLVLPLRDATISGRLVDANGDPVGGIGVVAERIGTQGDFGSGFAAPDGTFQVSGVGAGEWLLSAGGPGSSYNRTEVTVTLTAGDNAVADLVLTPRTTGAVFGSVNSSVDPFPVGINDICVVLVNTDGSAASDPYQTGFDGFFSFADLAAGTYTVRADECDPARVPPYATQYYGGGSTLAGASTFTVSAGQDTYLDPMLLVADSGPTEPTGPAHAVPEKTLKNANQGDVSAPDKAPRGSTITVVVGSGFAGEWVSVWFHDPTTQLGGWHQVAADGTVQVTLPSSSRPGQHKLAVQDRDDQLIGWTKVNVKH